MKYYVTTPDGEKGPLEEASIRQWLREGTFPGDAPLRIEGEDTKRPASDVFPGEAPIPARLSSNAAAGDVGYMYAPRAITSSDSDPEIMVPGSFNKGFLFGLFFGLLALFYSSTLSNVGYETKRGLRFGLAIHLGFGLLFRIIVAVMPASDRYTF